MGTWELLIVVLVVVLLFGGSQLPKLARSLGRAKSEFERGRREGGGSNEAPSPKAAPQQKPETN